MGEASAQESDGIIAAKDSLESLRKLQMLAKGRKRYALDTLVVRALDEVAYQYWENNADSTNEYGVRMLALSTIIDYPYGKALAYNSLATAHKYVSNYSTAVDYYAKAYAIRSSLHDTLRMGRCQYNIGEVYRNEGLFDSAHVHYVAARDLYSIADDSTGFALAQIGLGVVELEVARTPAEKEKTLALFREAQGIHQRHQNTGGVAIAFNSIGMAYEAMGQYAPAMDNYQAALDIFKTQEREQIALGTTHNNIGNVLQHTGLFPRAFMEYGIAEKIQLAIPDSAGLARTYGNVGRALLYSGNPLKARDTLLYALRIALAAGSLKELRGNYEHLSEVDSALKDCAHALAHYKTYINYRDSISSDHARKQVALDKEMYRIDQAEREAEAARVAAAHDKEAEDNLFMAASILIPLIIILTTLRAIKNLKVWLEQRLLNLLTGIGTLTQRRKTVGRLMSWFSGFYLGLISVCVYFLFHGIHIFLHHQFSHNLGVGTKLLWVYLAIIGFGLHFAQKRLLKKAKK